jgi:MraZ protein
LSFNSFNGHSKNSLNNNRVVIPSDFKKALSASAKQTFYIVPGPKNKCLVAFPADVWEKMIERMGESGDKTVKSQMKSMLMLSSKETLEGNAGRIRLPETLLSMVGIKGNKVHFFGEGQYFSIYGEEEGEKRFLEVFNNIGTIDFDEL